ncbi:MAG: glycosyltransferase [Chloroflexi bacterium]|nr:glycosyltransferase [Chloroflexota bacterium]
MERRLKAENISPHESVFYTFWFDEVNMGTGMAKENHPDIRLVSRTHGYDLYEEIYGIWPCRYESIRLLDGLFPDSDAGEEYLKKKYPEFSGIYQTALLGVPDPGGISRASEDKIFRIVSCAIIHPVKRLDLLMEGIAAAARMRPDQRFEWRHFGNGDALEEYQKKAADVFPSNAIGIFPGYTTQGDLIREYLSTPVDVFMNVSKTEGTPVSIMEAISCGIPVIATAVGGNVEIVSEKNGLLLHDTPQPEEVAQSILWALDNYEMMSKKRRGSRDVWRSRYDASGNFQRFAERLSEIRRA